MHITNSSLRLRAVTSNEEPVLKQSVGWSVDTSVSWSDFQYAGSKNLIRHCGPASLRRRLRGDVAMYNDVCKHRSLLVLLKFLPL